MKAKTNKHEEYIKAHAAAIPQLEAAIQQLKAARLDVSTESIADIVLSDSKAIRTQAKRLAAEDAKQIKIVTTREELTARANEYMNSVINNSQQAIKNALRVDEADALDLKAFIVSGDKVKLSTDWLADQHQRRTLEVAVMRGRVLQQCEQVRRAVEALNTLIADHPSFKAAILPEDTDYRSVIRVSYEGTIELHPDALDCLKE